MAGGSPAHEPRVRCGWAGRVAAWACLAAPFVALLWVPLYAREEPTLAGLPFFYWYQLAWLPLAAVLTATAHVLLRGRPRRSQDATPDATPGGRG